MRESYYLEVKMQISPNNGSNNHIAFKCNDCNKGKNVYPSIMSLATIPGVGEKMNEQPNANKRLTEGLLLTGLVIGLSKLKHNYLTKELISKQDEIVEKPVSSNKSLKTLADKARNVSIKSLVENIKNNKSKIGSKLVSVGLVASTAGLAVLKFVSAIDTYKYNPNK